MNNRNHLNVPCHDAEIFTWANGIGAINASDFSNTRRRPPYAWRVWKDSADIGFQVKSHKTGNVVLFLLDDVEYDNEGSVQTVIFAAHQRPNIKIKVFND